MKPESRIASAGAAATAVVALAMLAGAPAGAAVTLPGNFVNDIIVGGLSQPCSFAFLPDGRVLFVEQKTARVRMVVNGHIAATNPVMTAPGVNITGGERGLLGIAVDPAWPDSPYVYLFASRVGGFHRLARYVATGDLNDPNGENLTASVGSSLLLLNDIPDGNANHNAGGLRFGPDRMLYLSLGDDDFAYCDAFVRTTLRGQILRMRVDQLPPGGGTTVTRTLLAPPDNPFASSTNDNEKLVFAWGMRNPWRFQIDPVTGVIYGCDVGESDFEEMNEIHSGDFLGWPYREGNLSIVRATCPEPGGVGAQPYVPPIALFGRDASLHAIVSGGMYRPAPGGTSNWPAEYYPSRGDVFYTDYYVGDLKRITWNGSSWVPAAPVPGQPDADNWARGLTTAADFLVGPDGSLWWLAQFDNTFGANTGSLNRIRFVGNTGVGEPAAGADRITVTPNPARAAVELAFGLPRAGNVRLRIFDLSGREVRSLLDGDAPAGANRARWDGTDAAGRAVAAGLYFARLERPGLPATAARVMRFR